MILENLVSFVGALLKHIIGVLLLCWRRKLISGLIAFAIGVVVTALVVVITTGEAIPSVMSLIVALLFGLALAYGVALTVLVEELVLGAIDLIRIVEGDISAGAHIAEVVAEREVGQVGQGLRRLIGLPVSKRGPARPGATLPPLVRAQAANRPSRPAAASLVGAGAAIAAKTAAAAVISAAVSSTTPAPATPQAEAPGEPVPAGRLPRIAWTYEHEAVRPPATSAIDPVAVAPIPEATTPVMEAASPVASEGPSPASTSGNLSNTLAELAGGAAISAAAVLAPDGAPVEAAPQAPAEPVLEPSYDDERLAAPVSLTTPEGPAEPAERVDDGEGEEEAPELVSAEPIELAPVLAAPPGSAASAVVDAPAELAGVEEVASDTSISQPDGSAASPTTQETDQPAQERAPASRSDFSRRTLPLSNEGASLEGPRADIASGPRTSAPESGLWERLSNALISRTGAPSGPFAPAPPSQPDDEPAVDGAPPQEPGGEA